jgi:hypothetical protein
MMSAEVYFDTSAIFPRSQGANVAAALDRYAALVPTTTSVFMLARPCLRAPHAPA